MLNVGDVRSTDDITCSDGKEGGAEDDGASLHSLDLTCEASLAKVYRGECEDPSTQSHQQRPGENLQMDVGPRLCTYLETHSKCLSFKIEDILPPSLDILSSVF